jgi:exosortase F-associated protein
MLEDTGKNRDLVKRWILAVIAVIILMLTYLFQGINVSGIIGIGAHPYVTFIINKTTRLLLNDVACLLLIISIFQKKKYAVVAVYVFLFEVLVLLPVYFVLKLNIEGDTEISSPLLSQIHRMIINPTLMIVLMLSFFYQRYRKL